MTDADEARANIRARMLKARKFDPWKGLTTEQLRGRLHGLAESLPYADCLDLRLKASKPKATRKELITLIEEHEARIRREGGYVLP